ncbi:hypothetical protein KRMM14A1004_39060 [Krasilnikovia sp. MM14-A1004]
MKRDGSTEDRTPSTYPIRTMPSAKGAGISVTPVVGPDRDRQDPMDDAGGLALNRFAITISDRFPAAETYRRSPETPLAS